MPMPAQEGCRAACASPLGLLWLWATADGTLVRIDLPQGPAAVGHDEDSEVPQPGTTPAAAATLAAAKLQLQRYFRGHSQTFDLPLAWHGTPFQQAAWTVLRTIPFGQTISYAEQAQRLGRAAAVRAVGAANGKNPLPIVVPCHRVIGKNGALVGFGGGLAAKQWLLQHELRVLTSAR